MARNPAAFQEMLRSQDRQLSNIEVIKFLDTGFNMVYVLLNTWFITMW